MTRLTYNDIEDLPNDHELVRAYWRQEQATLQAHAHLKHEEDRAWEAQQGTPEALLAAIRDPDTLIKPSLRPRKTQWPWMMPDQSQQDEIINKIRNRR